MASAWARAIRVVDEVFVHPAGSEVEIVERKGVGHPDTLAELLADEFIRRYAEHAINNVGAIPNVCVDKTMLIGSLATMRPGSFTIQRNARALLIGKITRSVGRTELPIEDLFRESAAAVLGHAGLDGLLEHLSFEVINNDRVTDDHPREMYHPSSADGIRSADHRRWEAADTSCLTVEGPLTQVERMVV